ncbi:MAG: S-methyl-5'-thioinosine phosphorylase [Armatimonadia bacterium]|nr:S-methyl-5'-thioinosine phosphorylase [Armatimonadia bacterium]
MRIGLIAGSGVEDLYDNEQPREETVGTDYGDVPVYLLDAGDDREVVFLPRHGKGHSIPPHRINYRANIRALADLGCTCVMATNAVGSMNQQMQPGDLVVCDQFLDFTKQRPLTFFDGEDGEVRHVDVTEPYCPRLRETMREGCVAALGEELHPAGVYVCAEGPRFETAAEIAMYRQLGGDVVGMTGVPETVLAREAGLCYATVCVVSNWAAGITDAPISHEEVIEIMAQREEDLLCMLRETISRVTEDKTCACRRPFVL